MSLRRSAAAVAVATLSLASAVSAAPWALKPGEFYSEMSGNHISTNTWFRNSDEARDALGGRFDERSVRTHTELGWKNNRSVWIDVPFVSRTFAPTSGGSVTSTGLGDLGMGLRFPVKRGHTALAFELGWTAPLGGNRKLFPSSGGSGGLDGTSWAAQAAGPVRDSSAFFDGGLQSLSAGLSLGGGAGRGAYWTLDAGYSYRYLTIAARDKADRYADFATGSASLGLWVGDKLLVSGDLRGEWPMGQGEAYDRVSAPVAGTNGPELEAVSMVAGPRFTLRVDDRMDVFAGSRHTPSGRNVLHANQYYFGIAWKQTGLDRLSGALGGTKAR